MIISRAPVRFSLGGGGTSRDSGVTHGIGGEVVEGVMNGPHVYFSWFFGRKREQ